MSFQIKAPSTFDATLILVGQGREQKLKVKFRHKKKTEYAERLKQIAEGNADPVDVILELVESWDADADLSRESVLDLAEEQPGADWAILTGYGQALAVARKGN